MTQSLAWTREGDKLLLVGELDQDVLNPLWDARVEAMKGVTCIDLSQVSRVDTGSVLVESAGETMNDIVNAVTRVTDIMGEIASASDEQRRGIEQVAQAVSQMDSVTQQNAGLVEEAASATGQLATQADNLSACVAFFKLEEQTVAKQELAQPQVAPVVS